MFFVQGRFGPKSIECGNNDVVHVSGCFDGVIVVFQDGTVRKIGFLERISHVIPESVVEVAMTAKAPFFLTRDGSVVCGSNGNSVWLSWPAKHISCGWAHLLCLGTDGTLRGIGNDHYGQLSGISSVMAKKSRFVLVASGALHSAAVADDGSLWVWGWAQRGQCGGYGEKLRIQSDGAEMLLPREKNVSLVSCGDWQTAAVTKEGDAYVWGYDAWKSDFCHADGKLLIPSQRKVVSVACGTRTTVVALDDGTCMMHGEHTPQNGPPDARVHQVYAFAWTTCFKID